MKNLVKLTGIVLVAAAVFSFMACGGGGGGPEQLARPSYIQISGNILTWGAVQGASGYRVDVDGVTYDAPINSFSLLFLSDYGNYNIKVQALGDGELYTDSEWSDTITYTFGEPNLPALDAPSNLRISGTNAIWNAVPNAVRYSVEIDGVMNEASGPSYSLSGLTTPGTYTIKVKAIGDNVEYKNSVWSDTISYAVTTPKEPTKGLAFTLINDDTAYSVSKGTATDDEVIIPSVYNGLPVTNILYRGFAISNMMSITIPESVRFIGSDAFEGCFSLTSITIPESVVFIGSDAFAVCGLTSVTIPDSVNYIGNSAFGGCDSLESITIPFIGRSKDDTTDTFNWIFRGSSAQVPSRLKTVVITGGDINYRAFRDCRFLTSITIPDSVTSIGSEAFRGCSSLTSITIPDSVTSIGSEAFRDCSSLTSITIPDSVTSIGDGAFNDCSNLTTVNYSGNESSWSNIAIGTYNDNLTDANIIYNFTW